MKSLNDDLKSGNFKSVYLLCGEEGYLKNRYKNRLRQAVLPEDDTMNFSSYEGKGIDVRQVIDQAETMPFFADRRMILIENSGFFKNASADLADYIPQMPQETIMVFVESEVDKRGKLYKAVKTAGRIVGGSYIGKYLYREVLKKFKQPDTLKWVDGQEIEREVTDE
jgi:DNA polymerase-3 subunit delta